MLMVPCIADLY